MATQYTVKDEIRAHFRGTYEGKAQTLLPWRNTITRGLRKGGIFSMVSGPLGLMAAGVMAIASAPFVLPVLIGGGALFGLGFLGYKSSKKLYERIRKTGDELLEQDIANLKLVKSYVKDVLPEKTKSLQRARDEEAQAYTKGLAGRASQSEYLQDSRRAALLIIRDGMNLLEQQVEASRKEVDFFRNEAQTLGVEFASALQQPPAGASPVATSVTITNPPKLPVPSKSS